MEILEGLKEGDTVYYTESQDNGLGNFNFGGGMPGGGMSGGGMPGGGMPSGGNMPDNIPGGSGGMNFPGN